GLDRVAGVGPATLERLAPFLTFGAAGAEAMSRGNDQRVPLNQASSDDLERLPGIGAVRARAIVAFRDSAGPFRHVDDLSRVPGLPATVVRAIIPKVRLP